MIAYRRGNDLDLDAVIDLYRASTLGERRPIDDRDRMREMDFAYATYLSDLAVRVSHQRRGIGKELIRQTQAAAPAATLILLAAPAADPYYPHIGFTQHPQAWLLRPEAHPSS